MPLLALGIFSSPSEADRRAYVRATLVRLDSRDLFYRFIVGGGVVVGQHLDILRLELRDGKHEYKRTLTEKVLTWFLMARLLCPTAHFYGKADSDSYIVWHRLLPSLHWMAANASWAHRPLLVGMTSWTSYLPEARSFCGCCGGSAHHARLLQRKRNAAWGACYGRRADDASETQRGARWSAERNSTVDGPFPYVWGGFYLLSQSALRAVDTSPQARAFIAALRDGRLSPRMAYTEELVLSRLVLAASHDATVLRFAKDLIANIDNAQEDMPRIHLTRSPRCLAHVGLTSAANLTTGRRSRPWNLKEGASPRQVVVHHVASREQWRRIERLTGSWSRLSHPCLQAPLAVVYRHGETTDSQRYRIFPQRPRHALETQTFVV